MVPHVSLKHISKFPLFGADSPTNRTAPFSQLFPVIIEENESFFFSYLVIVIGNIAAIILISHSDF